MFCKVRLFLEKKTSWPRLTRLCVKIFIFLIAADSFKHLRLIFLESEDIVDFLFNCHLCCLLLDSLLLAQYSRCDTDPL